MPAQGNALGSVDKYGTSPEGATQGAMRADVPPRQGLVAFCKLPRALPWAGMGQAVGLQTSSENLWRMRRADFFGVLNRA